MYQRSVLIRSAVSGVMWGGIAVLVMMMTGGRLDSMGRIVWGLRGGLLAAPFIGIAVGLCWRLFRDTGVGVRIGISLVTLYMAAFLFLLAVSLPAFAAGEMWQASLSRILFDSWNLAIAGLTWTGFILILGPLAYLNHLWISRVDAVPSGQERAAG